MHFEWTVHDQVARLSLDDIVEIKLGTPPDGELAGTPRTILALADAHLRCTLLSREDKAFFFVAHSEPDLQEWQVSMTALLAHTVDDELDEEASSPGHSPILFTRLCFQCGLFFLFFPCACI